MIENHFYVEGVELRGIAQQEARRTVDGAFRDLTTAVVAARGY